MALAASYKTLGIVLYAISTLAALAGLYVLFASRALLAMLALDITFFNNGLVLALLKALGIVAIALSYLFCAAARNPVRYIAVVDALIFILFAAAGLNLYGLVELGLGAVYPASYLVFRSIVQVVLAIVILRLRPKGAARLATA